MGGNESKGQKLEEIVLIKDLECSTKIKKVTHIFLDKTGVLTKNQITVSSLFLDLNLHEAINLEVLKKKNLKPAYDTKSLSFELLYSAAVLASKNSDLLWDKVQNDNYSNAEGTGNQVDLGLLRFLQPIRDIRIERRDHKIAKFVGGEEAYLPFSSERKYEAIIVEPAEGKSGHKIFIRGAADVVLNKCGHIVKDGTVEELGNSHKDAFHKVLDGSTERNVAFAYMDVPKEKINEKYEVVLENNQFPEKGYTAIGLAFLNDPPREGVKEAIHLCQSKGIKFSVVSGDNLNATKSIAEKVGIITPGKSDHIENTGLENLTKEEIKKHATFIIGRATPQDKMSFVQMHEDSEKILFIGDGTNDAPALKASGLSAAMSCGTDVSKQASNMIILDDNLAGFLNAVASLKK